MKIIDNIKRKSGLKALGKALKLSKRAKFVHNLITARKIGIVALFNSNKDIDEIINFKQFLTDKHINVYIIGYYPSKEVPQQLLLRKDISIFCKNDINWYGKPEISMVEDFCRVDFDILIDLTMEEIFPLRWVSSISKSKFKVGNLVYNDNPFDFIIETEKQKGVSYLIDQVKHYLLLLNNRFAQLESEKETQTIQNNS